MAPRKPALGLVGLKTTNVLGVDVVKLDFKEGETKVIGGNNANGKSSLLNSVLMALLGRDGPKFPEPVRRGEDSAEVVIDLGEYIVTRTWNAAKQTTKLEITTPDGAVKRSPQDLLNGLLGKVAIDPSRFMSMNAKDQQKALLSVLDLPFDWNTHQSLRQEKFAQRTNVNREAKAFEARLLGMPEVEVGEVPNPAELSQKIRDIENHNQTIDSYKRMVVTTEAQILDFKSQVRNAQERLELAEARLAEERPLAEGKVLDATVYREELDSVQQLAATKASQDQRRLLVVEAIANSELQDRLNAELDAMDLVRDEAFAAADMPIPGLSVNEDSVLLNDVPLAQASSAERLKVGMAVAMAAEPEIRVLLMRDGAFLDAENLKVVKGLVKEHGWVALVEIVGEHGASVVIEAGTVKGSTK